MVGNRKYRIAKKMADRRNRLRSILQLMLRAVYTPLLSEQSVRVVKAWARTARLPLKQRRTLYDALLKHKRAGFQGVCVRTLKRTDVDSVVWQTCIVNLNKLDEFIRTNPVVSYNKGQGDVWLEQVDPNKVVQLHCYSLIPLPRSGLRK